MENLQEMIAGGHRASLNKCERISMIHFCFRFDRISSAQTDPPVDGQYKLWVKYRKQIPKDTRGYSKVDTF